MQAGNVGQGQGYQPVRTNEGNGGTNNQGENRTRQLAPGDNPGYGVGRFLQDAGKAEVTASVAGSTTALLTQDLPLAVASLGVGTAGTITWGAGVVKEAAENRARQPQQPQPEP